jgi:hypothetical protein
MSEKKNREQNRTESIQDCLTFSICGLYFSESSSSMYCMQRDRQQHLFELSIQLIRKQALGQAVAGARLTWPLNAIPMAETMCRRRLPGFCSVYSR